MGVAVVPSTILRWVMRYTEEFARRWETFELVVVRSWRADETYIKVKGGWVYLYRAVDERGRTVASYLSRSRDLPAGRVFFRGALKRHGQPRSITLDGFEPSHVALRRMGMRNEFNYRGVHPVKIRFYKYLNNIVEQDHRRVKFRVSAMLRFKSFRNARVVLAGIELIQKLKKGQYGVPCSFGTSSREIWCHVLGRLGATEPYFWAMSLRCQANNVAGVPTVATSARILRLSPLALAANRRRWSSLNFGRRPPSCSRRTRFSSRR